MSKKDKTFAISNQTNVLGSSLHPPSTDNLWQWKQLII